MAPALRMTRSIKEKLPIFFIADKSFLTGREEESYLFGGIGTAKVGDTLRRWSLGFIDAYSSIESCRRI